MLLAFVLLQFNVTAQELKDEQSMHTIMRTIGHQILLDAGDDSSKVLPIVQLEKEYTIAFENEFSFDPGKVSNAVDSIIQLNNVAFNYHLAVERCSDSAVVYSYEVTVSPETNGFPCGGRIVEKDCYEVIITLKDDAYIADAQNFTGAQLEEKDSNGVLYFAVLVFAGSGIFLIVYLNKKKRKAVNNPDIIPIGNYLFDKRNLELSFNGDKTELSSKEGDLLTLLHASANNTLKRETILKVVWEDEGAYVGRTLDVFISKLRKKLEQDERIKIMNVRGVGYKLVVA